MSGEIEQVFHHCRAVVRTEHGYYPARFTEKQLAFYKGLGERFETRSLCTAGVTMEFTTSAKEISFCYHAEHFARPYVAFDIYENDILRAAVRQPDGSETGTVRYQLAGEGSKICVYLPNLCKTSISDLNLGNFSPCLTKGKQKLLFLGDSITQGMVAQSPSMAYPSQLSRILEADILNCGVGAERFRKGNLDEALRGWPDKIFVAYGTNDSTQIDSLEEIGRNIAEYFAELRRIFPEEPVTVITPTWRIEAAEDAQYAEKLDAIRGLIGKEAEKRRCRLVDGSRLVPHLPEYFADGYLHPNDLGFSQYVLNYFMQENYHG